ncbi:MAG: DUF2628 domain-containing protein [Parvibaculaceae bacterium]|nr:DUF2628 domain-containing protein [Parvibaculaceae bacterium]
MRSYTVHHKDGEAADGAGFVFVKEGFCWPALFVPALWLLFRRHWLVLAGFLLFSFGLTRITADEPTFGFIIFIVQILIASEANDLRRWKLARHGYSLVGVAMGHGIDEAEWSFFHKYDGPLETRVPPAPSSGGGKPGWRPHLPERWHRRKPEPAPPHDLDVVGLFPRAGG